MTKTTTGSSRLTVILSWMIALICFVGGALYIWKMPSPDQEAIALQMKQQKNQKSRKEFDGKGKTGTGTTGHYLLIMPDSW